MRTGGVSTAGRSCLMLTSTKLPVIGPVYDSFHRNTAICPRSNRRCVDVADARLIECGKDDHRHGRELRIALLLAAEFPAVHHRHHQVEQNEFWPLSSAEVVERLAAIGDRLRIEAFEEQELGHH